MSLGIASLYTGQRPRGTEVSSVGQRSGVRVQSRSALAAKRRNRHGSDRSWKALAERRERELQWKVPRRMPRNAVVQEPDRCEGRHRRLAEDVQRSQASFEPEQPHAAGVCKEHFNNEPGTSCFLGTFGPKKPGRSIPVHCFAWDTAATPVVPVPANMSRE